MKNLSTIAASTLVALAAAVTAPPSFAATDQQARECGIAVSKLYYRYWRDMLWWVRDACLDRSRLAEVAERITEKRNKQLERLNDRYSDEVCDPDAAGLFPMPDFDSPSVENLMETASIGGATLIELCDNLPQGQNAAQE